MNKTANEMQVFQNSEFGELGVLEIDGKPYFPATACAKKLGYANPQKAIRDHCKGVNEIVTPTKGGVRKIRFIPEGDLYRLITHSKLEAAERFEKWVFDEVLPTIRKTGSYSMPGTAQPFTMEQMAQFAAAVAAQVVTQIVPIIVATVKEMHQEPTPMTTAPCEETISLHEVQPSRSHFRKKPGSIIDKLCPELRREVEEMLMDCRYTYADVAAKLRQEGVSISVASICRYAKRTGCYAAYEQRVEI